MDSSKHHLGTEGCSSSESGWTMYIVSPMQEDDECSNEVGDGNDHNTIAIDRNASDSKQESDDSMASDASSGPHHRYRRETSQGSYRSASLKRGKGHNFNSSSSATKPNKKEKKNDGNSSEKNRRLIANRKYSK